MEGYLRDDRELEGLGEVLGVASELLSPSQTEAERRRVARALVAVGREAVRPLVYTIGTAVRSGMEGREVDEHADEAARVLVRIGRDALPELDPLVLSGGRDVYVNEFAQTAIFRVMGPRGRARQAVCKHAGSIVRGDGRATCLLCGAVLEGRAMGVAGSGRAGAAPEGRRRRGPAGRARPST